VPLPLPPLPPPAASREEQVVNPSIPRFVIDSRLVSTRISLVWYHLVYEIFIQARMIHLWPPLPSGLLLPLHWALVFFCSALHSRTPQESKEIVFL
jgi:hypothetical protein